MQLFKILSAKDEDWLKGPQNRYEFPLPSVIQQQLMAKALQKSNFIDDAEKFLSLPRMQSGDPISYGYISAQDSKNLKKNLIRKGIDFIRKSLTGPSFSDAPLPLRMYSAQNNQSDETAQIWQLQVIPPHYIFIIDTPKDKDHWDQAELDLMSNYLQNKMKDQAYVTVIEASSDESRRQFDIRKTCDHFHFHPIKGCCMKEGGCIDCIKGQQYNFEASSECSSNVINLNDLNP